MKDLERMFRDGSVRSYFLADNREEGWGYRPLSRDRRGHLYFSTETHPKLLTRVLAHNHSVPTDVRISQADLYKAFGRPQPRFRAAASRPADVRPQPNRQETRGRGRPGTARQAALDALAAVFPDGVPDRTSVKDEYLVARVQEYLGKSGESRLSKATILRAAKRQIT
jgi:hypothetical protein